MLCTALLRISSQHNYLARWRINRSPQNCHKSIYRKTNPVLTGNEGVSFLGIILKPGYWAESVSAVHTSPLGIGHPSCS